MDSQTPSSNLLVLWLLCFLSLIISNSILTLSNGQPLPIVDSRGRNGVGRLRTYIVYVLEHEHHEFLSDEHLESYHLSFLPNSTLSSGEPRLLRSYRYVISGFAARLTREEVKAMKGKDGFVLAYPSQVHPLHTTHTPEFLGLSGPAGFWSMNNNQGEEMVIGVIDSGMTANHPSFDDDGMPPPPAKWAGKCKFKSRGYCNNKVVQAVTLSYGKPHPTWPPLDISKHGTAVASVAAGNFVKDANVGGKAKGTASGTAPRSHLAIYKASSTTDVNVLAAGEEAIKDGVDVISISSGSSNKKFHKQPADMLAFAAVMKNILVCACAGNNGTDGDGIIDNAAPWHLTVGSSTTDRIVGSSKKKLAPMVASHSSRGPSIVNGNILKPDVLAPGAEILVANTSTASNALFRFAYGTSFATPHVAGIAVLIKKEHPTWTPARIQSAIITTADDLDQSGQPIIDEKTNKAAEIFAVGAGQVNPTKSLDPGLVYDVEVEDYFGYLCDLKYTDTEITAIARSKKMLKCTDYIDIKSSDLNYPSISATMKRRGQVVTFKRSVTNIGLANSVYMASITKPEGVRVDILPDSLHFTKLNEKKSFEVKLTMDGPPTMGKKSAGGKLVWTSGKYKVKSPIAVAI